MLRPGIAAILLTVLLAGCSGGDGGPSAEGTDIPVPELEATATTGVIRVVFDDAIRPIPGATVEVVRGEESVRTLQTDESGFAGFESLQPGLYFVKASKGLLYASAQQTTEVVAGIDDPPAVKMLLALRTSDAPFFVEMKMDGFLQCSAFVGNWCFIANYYPCFAMETAGQPCSGNLTNDNSYFLIDQPLRELQRVPDRLQVEMVWESTQALGGEMNMRLDFIEDTSGFQYDNSTEETGASPLLVDMDEQELELNEIGTTRAIAIETFHGGATAAAIEQRFTDFVHVFYGYQPPEGWRFTDEGKVPPPE